MKNNHQAESTGEMQKAETNSENDAQNRNYHNKMAFNHADRSARRVPASRRDVLIGFLPQKR